jgi:hypothetical protein
MLILQPNLTKRQDSQGFGTFSVQNAGTLSCAHRDTIIPLAVRLSQFWRVA